MLVPQFTADASVYRTARHYQLRVADRRGQMSPAMGRGVRAAAAEEIEVFGCSPGFLELGEGPNMVCIPDPRIFGGGGGGGPVGPFDGGGDGGGNGSESGGKLDCNRPAGRIQVDACNWRHECAGAKKMGACCQIKSRECRKACGPSEGPGATDCRAECNASFRLCIQA
jgi:hypothetical protein